VEYDGIREEDIDLRAENGRLREENGRLREQLELPQKHSLGKKNKRSYNSRENGDHPDTSEGKKIVTGKLHMTRMHKDRQS